MRRIRVAGASGVGPSVAGAFDAALDEVGLSRYNLVPISSVIPTDATVEIGPIEDHLGPTGHVLLVVLSRASLEPGGTGTAGLAWARSATGEGIFYEASAVGADARTSVADELERGLDHGIGLRGWEPIERERHLASVDAPADSHGCAVVVAAYGRSTSPWG